MHLVPAEKLKTPVPSNILNMVSGINLNYFFPVSCELWHYIISGTD